VSESSRLDARYGRRPPNPRRVRLLVAAGLAVLLALAIVLYAWSRSGSGLVWTVTGYHADSSTQTTVSFSVSKGADQRISCRIIAKDRYTDVVGSIDVTLAEKGTRVARTVHLPTRGLAVIGTVDSCRVVG
jgi:hypothetical protein